MPLYLKRYRLDDDKIAKRFNIEHTTDLKFSNIRCIDRDSYRYIASGFEPSGKLNVIIVLTGGNDAVTLTQRPMPASADKTLLDIARKVCTPGVWPCYDDVDDPSTFWAEWLKHGRFRLGEMKEKPKDH
ncbi:hypothetical protein BJ912DRAFT_883407 [Pholiota molesta]|nr:hypothetical protein BJ912DRAFT_883407 [Pholiota molesta]